MRKIVKAAGALIGVIGFAAVVAGCAAIENCVDTIGISLAAAGLIGMVAGATMADAWYHPDQEYGYEKLHRCNQRSAAKKAA